MKRIALFASLALLAGCGNGATTPGATPTSSPPSVSSSPSVVDPLAVPLPDNGDVARTFAPDGWPVFVIGRGPGKVDVFSAIAQVAPGRIGDEVGWCHVNHLFEATTYGRRYDDTGHSASGIGGLVRYAGTVGGNVVHVGARGEMVTGKAKSVAPVPCATRALLRPDYAAPVTLLVAKKGATTPVRVVGNLSLGSTSYLQSGNDSLAVTEDLAAELAGRQSASLSRTFWVTVSGGKVTHIGISSVLPPDEDDSQSEQFGYVVKMEGDWLYFDRAEILLGDAAIAAAKADGKPVPEDGDHYLRNNSPRLRRYRVEKTTQVLVSDISYDTNDGRTAIPGLRKKAGKDFSTTLRTSKGKLLQIGEADCGG